MINLCTINKRRNLKLILNQLSCTLNAGSISTFIGRSGAGKTTLLRCIANLESIESGSITIEKKPTTNSLENDYTLGYLFQQYALFSHLSVLDNCIQPLQVVKKFSYKKAYEQALSTLKQLNIAFLANRKPTQLSGGQQQRAALARTLCMSPNVLILDEPTSALDPQTKQELITIIQKLKQDGLTLIIASHDTNFITQISDYIYLLEQGSITEKYARETDKKLTSKISIFLNTMEATRTHEIT